MPSLALQQLPAAIKRGLAPLYVLHGAEVLHSLEAADSLRKAAKSQGYTDREVLQFDAKTPWDGLFEAAGSMSLFADKRVLDIRLPTGKPGRAGTDALEQFCRRLPEDTISLITLPELERDQLKSAWFTALAQHGLVIECPAVARRDLPDWLHNRAAQVGLTLAQDAAEYIAERVEGNLMAAKQEIDKLVLLCPSHTVDLDAARDAVMNMARFNLEDLLVALLKGEAARAVRVLDGLREEDEVALPFLVWAVSDEARILARLQSLSRNAGGGMAGESAALNNRAVWLKIGRAHV